MDTCLEVTFKARDGTACQAWKTPSDFCQSTRCPYCQSTEVIKAGKQANGAQRYQCQNGRCERRIFLLQYQDRGRALEIHRQVVDMAINGSGIRETARVLRISPTTVIAVLKKSRRASTR